MSSSHRTPDLFSTSLVAEDGVAPALRLETVLEAPKPTAYLRWRESGSGRECARGSVVVNPDCAAQ
ncbi:MAG: hypothetical protein ABI680_16420 [Chthoniobacteraceae bacterium]